MQLIIFTRLRETEPFTQSLVGRMLAQMGFVPCSWRCSVCSVPRKSPVTMPLLWLNRSNGRRHTSRHPLRSATHQVGASGSENAMQELTVVTNLQRKKDTGLLNNLAAPFR
eukprot:6316923-Amphidinium_carterae.1